MNDFFIFIPVAPIPSFIMTTRRYHKHIFTTELEPIDEDKHQDFVNRIRDVVDAITYPEQEYELNRYLGRGANWCEDGTYIKNTDALQIAYGEQIGGDCFLKSFECYWRLRGAGAKRVCGIRTAIYGIDNADNPHYWVENKGKVFDWGGGQQKIYDKDRFYELMKIVNVREGNDMGCFRKDRPERTLEEKTREILMKHGVKALIEFIRRTCNTDNVEALVRLKKNKTG